MRPGSSRGRPPEPSLGACSILEAVDIAARVPEDKLEEVQRLNPEARLGGDRHSDPDIPWHSPAGDRREQTWIWVVAGDLDAYDGVALRDRGHLRWKIETPLAS
jgi:hypothetical protein